MLRQDPINWAHFEAWKKGPGVLSLTNEYNQIIKIEIICCESTCYDKQQQLIHHPQLLNVYC